MSGSWWARTPSAAVGLLLAATLAGCTAVSPTPVDSSPSSSSAQPAGTEADAVRLPHQGARSTDADVTDWTPTSWTYRPCGDDAPLTVGADVDTRSIAQTGPEYSRQETVAVFPDAAAAVAFVARLDAAAAACPPTAGGEHGMRAGDLAGPWGRGRVYSFFVATRDGVSGAVVGHMGLDYLVLARTGRAVAAVHWGGEFTPAIDRFDPAVIAELRPDLERIAGQLCRFTDAGCG